MKGLIASKLKRELQAEISLTCVIWRDGRHQHWSATCLGEGQLQNQTRNCVSSATSKLQTEISGAFS